MVHGAAPMPASGNTDSANTSADATRATSRKNIHRQPKSWMTGPPMATPNTGPPAPTSDHKPIAFTRSLLVEERQDERHGRRAEAAPTTRRGPGPR